MARVVLCPPKPKLLLITALTSRSTQTLGVKLRSRSGSGWWWLIVGGITPLMTTIVLITASTAPAAPSMWPVADFVELTLTSFACSPIERVLELFENQDSGTLSHHEPVARRIEWTGRRLGTVVSLRERLHVGESTDCHRRHGGLRAAGDHYVGVTVLDRSKRITYCV